MEEQVFDTDSRPPVIVTTAEEMGNAMKNNENTIEVVGDLANKVIKIKATGAVSWAVAATALAAAVTCAIWQLKTPPQTQTGKTISFTGAAGGTAVAAGVLGKAAIAATSIAVAAGGVGALSTLRDDYKIISKEKGKLILQHK